MGHILQPIIQWRKLMLRLARELQAGKAPAAAAHGEWYNVRSVSVVLDAELMAFQRVNFHPLVNHMTTTIEREDLLAFIRATGHDPRILRLPEPAPETSEKAEAAPS